MEYSTTYTAQEYFLRAQSLTEWPSGSNETMSKNIFVSAILLGCLFAQQRRVQLKIISHISRGEAQPGE